MNHCLHCGKEVKNKYCNSSCQNRHQGSFHAEKRYGKITNFNVICSKCGIVFSVKERELLHPQKKKYFCSRSCANSNIWDEDHKKKISNAVKNSSRYQNSMKTSSKNFREKYEKNPRMCIICSFVLPYSMRNRKTCSDQCYKQAKLNAAFAGGKKRVETSVARSKNEILFSSLCCDRFKNVEVNKIMFNGWDADVVIHDVKVAVLWNGKWHYEKITRKHSLKQVQTRDKIKIEEIKKFGYIPYIIKDMGSFNEEFVFEEFKKFLKAIDFE